MLPNRDACSTPTSHSLVFDPSVRLLWAIDSEKTTELKNSSPIPGYLQFCFGTPYLADVLLKTVCGTKTKFGIKKKFW